MYQKMIAKQIIDFNKATFDNTFDAITVLQDHSEKMVNDFLEQASLFPLEGKKVITGWIEAYKKGQKSFKDSVDNSFKTVEDYFDAASDTSTDSTEKPELPVKKVADKTIPATEAFAGDAAKENSRPKKEKIVEGKAGAGSTKAVRKEAKTVQQ